MSDQQEAACRAAFEEWYVAHVAYTPDKEAMFIAWQAAWQSLPVAQAAARGVEVLADRVRVLEAENADLREVLGWYARCDVAGKACATGGPGGHSYFHRDDGKRARDALARHAVARENVVAAANAATVADSLKIAQERKFRLRGHRLEERHVEALADA